MGSVATLRERRLCDNLAQRAPTTSKDMPSLYRFTIVADYFQFVLMDETSADDFSTIWTEPALERMLAAGESAICAGTLRNVDVPVEIRLTVERPSIDLDQYDHAVEASIQLPSGKLIVMGCTGYLPDAPRIDLLPGCYRALFLVSGIESIKTEWEQADDLYAVYLWPEAAGVPQLIKHWKRSPRRREV